mmetsp:Transcript_20865/g.47370  ORF Transcript_20865/g.47370 Transcript_20865/m.47370 type:complete len:282 (-) Transcript_20865:329-1174(-)
MNIPLIRSHTDSDGTNYYTSSSKLCDPNVQELERSSRDDAIEENCFVQGSEFANVIGKFCCLPVLLLSLLYLCLSIGFGSEEPGILAAPGFIGIGYMLMGIALFQLYNIVLSTYLQFKGDKPKGKVVKIEEKRDHDFNCDRIFVEYVKVGNTYIKYFDTCERFASHANLSLVVSEKNPRIAYLSTEKESCSMLGKFFWSLICLCSGMGCLMYPAHVIRYSEAEEDRIFLFFLLLAIAIALYMHKQDIDMFSAIKDLFPDHVGRPEPNNRDSGHIICFSIYT